MSEYNCTQKIIRDDYMNLEMEYYSYKKLVLSDEEKLIKFEVLDTSKMDDSQLESYHRGVESLKESIKETNEILDEIKDELNEFIKNGGEVSEKIIMELASDDADSTNSELRIVGLEKVHNAGVVNTDNSINEKVVEVNFSFNNKEISTRAKVDMDYESIDFGNPESISGNMVAEATNKAYIKYATYFVDDETITGKIGVDMEVTSAEGETSNIMNDDVDQLHDIISMMGEVKAAELCRQLLINKGLLSSDSNLDDEKSSSEKESSDDEIWMSFCDYTVAEIEEIINTVNKDGVYEFPATVGSPETIMKIGSSVFIDDEEFDGSVEEAVIYYISEEKMSLKEVREYLLDAQADTESVWESSEEDEVSSLDDEEVIVEFEVISKKDSNISIKGYMDVEDADDESPLYFYDQRGFEYGSYVPSNPFNEETNFEEYDEYEHISSEFQSDVLFIQYLVDFADDDKLVDRGDYLLKINDGAYFFMEIEEYDDINKDYYVRVIPKFNGELIELNKEVFFEDPYTYEETKVEDIIYDNGYIVEFPKSYFEGNDIESIIEDYKDAFEKAFVQSKSLDLGIFAKYGENVEQQFEQYSASEIGVLTDETVES